MATSTASDLKKIKQHYRDIIILSIEDTNLRYSTIWLTVITYNSGEFGEN